MNNIILLTDSYKISHHKQYPPKTTSIYSYFESRGGMFNDVVFFGLQYYLMEYLSKPITQENIDEAEEIYALHFGDDKLFHKAGWQHILDKHGGYLPIRIKAVPEGLPVPTRNVLMTVENTDPECFWLTNYLETLLSQVWFASTVATLSREIKKLIYGFLERTGDPSGIDFKLHDFGFRGVSSVESAAVGGLAHLINFRGTDTIAGIVCGRKYYNCKMAGHSIPAAEHSTITSWGRDKEVDAYRNMIKQFGSGSLYAVVSDSYDIYNACSKIWGETLKSEVEAANATLVIRPDSGVPSVVVLECLHLLGEKFGFSYNSKGYKVLNPKVRVIQGDGVDYEEIRKILRVMEEDGWSADNIAFGMGGGLLQKLNRDTQKFAFKCSHAKVNGQDVDVFKSPITDSGKVSKKGLLSLTKTYVPFGTKVKTEYKTISGLKSNDVMELVFENGRIIKQYTLDDVRSAATI